MGVINNVKALISTSKLTNLANAIRNKTGEVESYTVDEMIEKINGMGSSVLTSLNVTTNGIYTPESGVDGFSQVDVDVNPDLRPLSVSENGQYSPDGFDGFSRVNVDVPDQYLIAEGVEDTARNNTFCKYWTEKYVPVRDETRYIYIIQVENNTAETGIQWLFYGLRNNSDNVIGVNGIGPKGAVKLLHEYNHIEDILNNIDKLDNSTKTKINNSKDWLMLAQQLITLKHDAIKINDIDEYRTHINHQKLASFMDKYGFRNLDKEIRNQGFLRNNNKKTDENTTQAQQQHSMFEQNNNNNTNTPRIKTAQDDKKGKDKKTDDTIKENTIITIKTTLFG